MKMLLKTRPYEREKGTRGRRLPDRASRRSARPSRVSASRTRSGSAAIVAGHGARPRPLPRRARPTTTRSRPLIGVVGEIFCRQNTFSNFDLIRVVEEQGGECWLSDIGEWVWYTDDEQRRRLIDERQDASARTTPSASSRARSCAGTSTPCTGRSTTTSSATKSREDVREVLEMSLPYLPYTGALGEMVLSSGKSIYMYEKGADGIIDISPFTCMNGIVTEAVYPSLSKDLDDLPIRVFYFDGTQGDLERDVGIFIELARTYQRRKHKTRALPRVLRRLSAARRRGVRAPRALPPRRHPGVALTATRRGPRRLAGPASALVKGEGPLAVFPGIRGRNQGARGPLSTVSRRGGTSRTGRRKLEAVLRSAPHEAVAARHVVHGVDRHVQVAAGVARGSTDHRTGALEETADRAKKTILHATHPSRCQRPSRSAPCVRSSSMKSLPRSGPLVPGAWSRHAY